MYGAENVRARPSSGSREGRELRYEVGVGFEGHEAAARVRRAAVIKARQELCRDERAAVPEDTGSDLCDRDIHRAHRAYRPHRRRTPDHRFSRASSSNRTATTLPRRHLPIARSLRTPPFFFFLFSSFRRRLRKQGENSRGNGKQGKREEKIARKPRHDRFDCILCLNVFFLNVYFYVGQLRLKRLGLSIENKGTRYSSAICTGDRPNRWSKSCLANEVLGSTRSSDFS